MDTRDWATQMDEAGHTLTDSLRLSILADHGHDDPDNETDDMTFAQLYEWLGY